MKRSTSQIKIRSMCGRLIQSGLAGKLTHMGILIRCVRKEHHCGECSGHWDMAGN